MRYSYKFREVIIKTKFKNINQLTKYKNLVRLIQMYWYPQKPSNDISSQIATWRDDYELSEKDLTVLRICLGHHYNISRHSYEPLTEFIHVFMPDINLASTVPVTWIKDNLTTLIEYFFTQKIFKHNSQSIKNLLIQTKSGIDKKGRQIVWQSMRRNYQIALFAEPRSLWDITIRQLKEILKCIKYLPMRIILVNDVKNRAKISLLHNLELASCPSSTLAITHNPAEVFEITDHFSHIPCLIFGSNRLKTHPKQEIICYPSYLDVHQSVQTIKQSIIGSKPYSQLITNEYAHNDLCNTV